MPTADSWSSATTGVAAELGPQIPDFAQSLLPNPPTDCSCSSLSSASPTGSSQDTHAAASSHVPSPSCHPAHTLESWDMSPLSTSHESSTEETHTAASGSLLALSCSAAHTATAGDGQLWSALGTWSGQGAHMAGSEWAALPSVLVSSVAGYMKERVRDVQHMMAVCRSWREALLGEPLLLKTMYFPFPPVAWPHSTAPAVPSLSPLHQRLPFHSPPKHPVLQSHLEHSYRFPQHKPVLLLKAAKAGCPSACACLARMEEAAGDMKAAMKWWDRAGKRGHVEGKVIMGLALYKGVAGQNHDPESAHMWLEQAAKQLLEDSSCVVPTSRYDTMLSQSALVLGYLHFDGETCRMVGGEKQAAVRWFKIAAAKGNKEAEEVLGWIFNTGQYG